jgi:hypothetical protein
MKCFYIILINDDLLLILLVEKTKRAFNGKTNAPIIAKRTSNKNKKV